MTIVTLNHLGTTFYLRRTIWTRFRDRATEFATAEAANIAINRARKFMPAKYFNAARIVTE